MFLCRGGSDEDETDEETLKSQHEGTSARGPGFSNRKRSYALAVHGSKRWRGKAQTVLTVIEEAPQTAGTPDGTYSTMESLNDDSDSEVEEALLRPCCATIHSSSEPAIAKKRQTERPRAGSFSFLRSEQELLLSDDSANEKGSLQEQPSAAKIRRMRKMKAYQRWRRYQEEFLERRKRKISESPDGAASSQSNDSALFGSTYSGPPGVNTWNAIVQGRLISSKSLRARLSDQWTVVGVVTALVASWAISGVHNSGTR